VTAVVRPKGMRTYAILLVPLLGMTAACGGGGDRDPGGPAPETPTGRVFLSTEVTEGGNTKPLVGGSRIQLAFDSEDGVGVEAGCNHIGGKVRFDGAKMVVTDLSTTDKACEPELMAQDDWLHKFLSATPTWRLSGHELVLTSGGTKMKMLDRVVADPDQPLAGTRWELDSIVTEDAVSSIPAGVQAHLLFAADGTVTGSTGCNQLNTKATVEGLKITFSPVITTKIACQDERASVEKAVLRVLGQPVTYRIEARSLTLTGADGHGIRLTAA
jgi:heat shock protein HslJ